MHQILARRQQMAGLIQRAKNRFNDRDISADQFTQPPDAGKLCAQRTDVWIECW